MFSRKKKMFSRHHGKWSKRMKCLIGFPGGSDGKVSACNVGDQGSIPESRRSPEEGTGNPLEYSCLENPTDRGAWQATVHGLAKSQTQLNNWHFHFHIFHHLWSTNYFLNSATFRDFSGTASYHEPTNFYFPSSKASSEFNSPLRIPA